MTVPTIRGSADISPCGRHRYTLTREWGGGERVLFIMLNPSTADATEDDPTITRCMGFAARWGYGALDVANLFTYRATDPAELVSTHHPLNVWPESNARLISAVERADAVVLAWGSMAVRKWAAVRVAEVLSLIEGAPTYRIGKPCKDGNPRHPLYLSATTELEAW